MAYLLLILGLALLIIAGEFLVRGAAGLALKAKIPPMIVGLTVVSIGTSAPELFASLNAAFAGVPALAIGNVVGSNIANLGLVLAITAIIFPIPIVRDLPRFDYPVMIIASLLFFYFVSDLFLDWWEGLIFVVALVLYILALVRKTRKAKKAEAIKIAAEEVEEYEEYQGKSYWALLGLILSGCVGLYFGADWFVKGASQVAKSWGVTDHVIGVTLVAFGTSVPELVASCIAAFKKETDISIGNLVGSNIFNLLAVMGITALVKPLQVDPELLSQDIWWMLGISALLLPLMFFGGKIIGKMKGLIFLAIYILYILVVLV